MGSKLSTEASPNMNVETRDGDKGLCAGSRVTESQRSLDDGNGIGVGTLAEKRGGGGSNPSPRTIYPATHTPDHLAHRMCRYGHGVRSDDRVLEPTAGTGNLAKIISQYSTDVVAVELNKRNHALMVQERTLGMTCINYDFLRLTPDSSGMGLFDWVIMCPPRNSDEHIEHAYRFLAPGGNLIALVQEQNVDTSRYGFYARLNEPFEINGERLHCGLIYLWAGH